jgi:TatD DNase family protein
MRGKQNHPKYIKAIAEYITLLRNESFEYIAQNTTKNALHLFDLQEIYENNYKNNKQ